MNSFDKCREIELESMPQLEALLKTEAYNGQYVLINKGGRAAEFQATIGDVIFNDKNYQIKTIEIKTEKRYTGNLFLEFLSNKSFEPNRFNTGWLMKIEADVIWYYFSDKDLLYSIELDILREWCFGRPYKTDWGKMLAGKANLFKYDRRIQQKYEQKNLTEGFIVPVRDLFDEMNIIKPNSMKWFYLSGILSTSKTA